MKRDLITKYPMLSRLFEALGYPHKVVADKKQKDGSTIVTVKYNKLSKKWSLNDT